MILLRIMVAGWGASYLAPHIVSGAGGTWSMTPPNAVSIGGYLVTAGVIFVVAGKVL